MMKVTVTSGATRAEFEKLWSVICQPSILTNDLFTYNAIGVARSDHTIMLIDDDPGEIQYEMYSTTLFILFNFKALEYV